MLVSRASGSDGGPADRDAYEPAVSADGRVIAFTSRAGNLGRPGRTSTIFVRDLRTATTTPVSTGVAGDAFQPAISADGRHVAFAVRPQARRARRRVRARAASLDLGATPVFGRPADHAGLICVVES